MSTMSTIDEIMKAVEESQDLAVMWYRDEDFQAALNDQYRAVRSMVAATLAEARREGAEQMREAIASEFDRRDGRAGIGFYEPHEPAEIIRDMPLPTGPRQAVLLTQADVTRELCLVGLRAQTPTGLQQLCRAIETAVLAANGLEMK